MPIHGSTRLKHGLLFICSIICVHASSAMDHAWDETYAHVDQFIQLEQEVQNLPQDRWFLKDKDDASEELQDLYLEVIESLQVSEVSLLRDEYLKLETEIDQTSRQISDLKAKRVTAPETTSTFSLTSSKELIDKKIKQHAEKLRTLREQQKQLISELVTLLATHQVVLTPDQAKLYLSLTALDTADLLELYSLFINVQQVMRQVALQVEQGDGDAQTIKRYYAMYVVLSKTLLLSYDRALDSIQKVYLVRLDELNVQRTRTEAETIEMMMRESLSDQQRYILSQNLKALKMVEKIRYKTEKHLQKVYDQLTVQRATLKQNVEIAENTYKTAFVASSLLSTLADFNSDYTMLNSMILDPIIPMNDEVLSRYFDEFTTQLKP